MNKTKIDWADMTWNPVTGCLHGCEYCYARKIANRFGNKYMPFGIGCNVLDEKVDGIKGIDPYPFGFEPTLHEYRLDDPKKIKKPQTIFVCSMADLFGDWVPDEWIDAVMGACKQAPQHRYLFLTKNPRGLEKVHPPYGDFWFGASATTTREAYDASSDLYWHGPAAGCFLSIEPIHEQINTQFIDLHDTVRWIIVGAETGNRKDKPIVCKWWIDELTKECERERVPIFMKESLRALMGEGFKQEFPWGDEDDLSEMR